MQEKEREKRMFGGEAGDDGSLCGGMLEVVRSLFGGDLDFDCDLDKGGIGMFGKV